MSQKRKLVSQLLEDEGGKRRRNNEAERLTIDKSHCRPGTIISLTLQDFMCHSNLVIRFNGNVNFLVGRNGSGKSAILTALMVGLGLKATATNRSSTVKGLIKTGCTHAIVTTVLNNVGVNPYKSDIYGEYIIIERIFSTSGSASVKIKNSNGTVIGKQMKEVKNITSALNIQLDNPMCILTQDTSRNFLNSNDPSQRYNLLVRATKLDVLYTEMQSSAKQLPRIKTAYNEKLELIKELTNNINSLQERIKCCQDIEQVKAKSLILHRELLWSVAHVSRCELQQKKKTVEELNSQKENFQVNCDHAQELYTESNNKMNGYMKEISDLTKAVDEYNTKKAEYENNEQELKSKLKRQTRLNEEASNKIKRCQNQKENVVKEMEEITNKLSRQEQIKLEQMKEREKLEEKAKKTEDLMQVMQNEIFQYKQELGHKEKEKESTDRELIALNNRITNTESELAYAQKQTDNKLAAYGRDANRLVQAIKANRNRFKQLPKGPLGSYISVKDKKWSIAIEGFLGRGFLHAFCVDNVSDRDILVDLMKQIYQSGKPMIITSKFLPQVHDVRNNMVQVPERCECLFEAISVSDPVVMNCLIDNKEIECILLIQTEEDAIAMMSDERNVPKSCSQGITLTGDQFYPDPNYRMYSSRLKSVSYLQQDTSLIIHQHKSTLHTYTDKRRELMAVSGEMKTQIDSISSTLSDKENKYERCKTSLGVLNKNIYSMKVNVVAYADNLKELEAELKNLDNSMSQLKAAMDSLTTESKETDKLLSEKKSDFVKFQKGYQVLSERVCNLEKLMNEESKRKNELEVNISSEKKRFAEINKHLKAATEALGELEKKVLTEVNEASKLGTELKNIRPVEVVYAEIKHSEKMVKQMQAEDESLEELLEKHKSKKEIRTKMQETLDMAYINIEKLSNAYKRCKQLFKHTREYFDNFIGFCFKRFLEMRKMKGLLKIDFQRMEVELMIQPQRGVIGVVANTNLSGGERSFSTVAFLYSLWQCLDFPFYFLDEFDVFMDKLNRLKIMEILIHHAKSHPHMQFVFLTPQDTSFLSKEQQVTTFRLDDPS